MNLLCLDFILVFCSLVPVNLYQLKTYHEVIDEIYYNVTHLEPWEKGSRKTSGQTGMCGGVSVLASIVAFFSLFLSLPPPFITGRRKGAASDNSSLFFNLA